MTKSDTAMLEDIAARACRIETRLTSYLVSIGVHGRAMAEWVDVGYISVTSPDVTLRECLRCVPSDYDGEVNIVHNGTILAVVNV